MYSFLQEDPPCNCIYSSGPLDFEIWWFDS